MNCWEYKKCGRERHGVHEYDRGACPAAQDAGADGLNDGQNGGRICWAIAGTFCMGETQGTFAQKQPTCMVCDFYHVVSDEARARGKKFVLLKPGQR